MGFFHGVFVGVGFTPSINHPLYGGLFGNHLDNPLVIAIPYLIDNKFGFQSKFLQGLESFIAAVFTYWVGNL